MLGKGHQEAVDKNTAIMLEIQSMNTRTDATKHAMDGAQGSVQATATQTNAMHSQAQGMDAIKDTLRQTAVQTQYDAMPQSHWQTTSKKQRNGNIGGEPQ